MCSWAWSPLKSHNTQDRISLWVLDGQPQSVPCPPAKGGGIISTLLTGTEANVDPVASIVLPSWWATPNLFCNWGRASQPKNIQHGERLGSMGEAQQRYACACFPPVLSESDFLARKAHQGGSEASAIHHHQECGKITQVSPKSVNPVMGPGWRALTSSRPQPQTFLK